MFFAAVRLNTSEVLLLTCPSLLLPCSPASLLRTATNFWRTFSQTRSGTDQRYRKVQVSTKRKECFDFESAAHLCFSLVDIQKQALQSHVMQARNENREPLVKPVTNILHGRPDHSPSHALLSISSLSNSLPGFRTVQIRAFLSFLYLSRHSSMYRDSGQYYIDAIAHVVSAPHR